MTPKKILYYVGIFLFIMGFGAVAIGGAYAAANHSLNSLGTSPVDFKCLSQASALLLVQEYPPGQVSLDTTCPGYNPYSAGNFYSGFYTPSSTTTTTTSTTTSTTQGGATVTQPIEPIPDSGAVPQSVTLTGCNVSPSVISGNAATTNVQALPNCSITLTLPVGYGWTGSGSQTWQVATCSTGVCGIQAPNYVATTTPTTTASGYTTTTTVTVAYCGSVPFNPAVQTCTSSATTLTTTLTEQGQTTTETIVGPGSTTTTTITDTATFSTTVVSTVVNNSTIQRTITMTEGHNLLPLASSVLIVYGLVLMAVGGFVTLRTRKP